MEDIYIESNIIFLQYSFYLFFNTSLIFVYFACNTMQLPILWTFSFNGTEPFKIKKSKLNLREVIYVLLFNLILYTKTVMSVMSPNIKISYCWNKMALNYNLCLYSWIFIIPNIFGYMFNQFLGIQIYLDILLALFHDISSLKFWPLLTQIR